MKIYAKFECCIYSWVEWLGMIRGINYVELCIFLCDT